MKRILVTGATGNIGLEVIRFLFKIETQNEIIAGVRDVEKSKLKFSTYPNLGLTHFDFENPETFNNALEYIDCVFLLRPPHLADIPKYFHPLIQAMQQKQIKEVVFLSVQGAEKSNVIPHNKIEKVITSAGMHHVFLRPSYFMQNLTTTLLDDIRTKRKIMLPAGKAKFNWIDVENIGETAAIILEDFDTYKDQIFEITGYENKNFQEVTDLMNEYIANKIIYQSPGPLSYYFQKRKDGLDKGMIMVMIMLHFLARFQKEPLINDFYERLTGKKPTTLKEFIAREIRKFDES